MSSLPCASPTVCKAYVLSEEVWGGGEQPAMEEGQASWYLRGLDPVKFTGPNGLHPWMPREQMKSLQIHYHFLIDHGNWVRSPKAGERQMPNSSSKKAKNNDLGNYRPLKLTLVTGEIKDWVLLEHISGHMEEQMVTGNSNCGFMKTKTCLTIQIGFWD